MQFNTVVFATYRTHTERFVCFADLRQELAVRERASDSTRMSAPSSPTLDIDKMDTAVQASLSLPATPVGKTIDHPFMNQKGIHSISSVFSCYYFNSTLGFTLSQTSSCSQLSYSFSLFPNHWFAYLCLFLDFSVGHWLWKLSTHPICKDLCSQHCW